MPKLSLLVFVAIFHRVVSTCPAPNDGPICSGHGLCDTGFMVKCTCFDGWTGGGCEFRTCPQGRAWADIATAVDTAHAMVECSNRGFCNRESGACQCHQGFTGKACQRSLCPNKCSLHGTCVSMRHHAFASDMSKQYVTPWDSKKIYGCHCDDGYYGPDCSLRRCPTGDDPLTAGQLNEVQLFKCTATGGSFRLSFMGKYTSSLSFDVSAVALRTAVEALPGIYVEPNLVSVTVTYLSGTTFCASDGSNPVKLEFTQNFGDVPPLTALTSGLTGSTDTLWEAAYDGASIVTGLVTMHSVTGTKENAPCSNRGLCDPISGVCTCYGSFTTSNGIGSTGVRGDCGYNALPVAACPGVMACSSHGFCSSSPEYQCSCSVGWTSGDCSLRECPKGKPWFGAPVAQDEAHSQSILNGVVECSNAGLCDSTNGICTCFENFEGEACGKLKCPGEPECSAHGTCLTMEKLAEYGGQADATYAVSPVTYGAFPNDPLRWDYDVIQGCLCDSGFHGYDCSLMSCPRGDDPHTPGVWEKQLIHCNATEGTFKLVFGRVDGNLAITDVIDATTTYASGLKAKLEALATVGTVDVRTINIASGVENSNTICSSDASDVVEVVFKTDFGSLPALHPFDVNLFNSIAGGGAIVRVYHGGDSVGNITSVTGTKENAVCSNRGTCDTATGQCLCYTGYGSSDGNGGSGVRADCGYPLPFIPVAVE